MYDVQPHRHLLGYGRGGLLSILCMASSLSQPRHRASTAAQSLDATHLSSKWVCKRIEHYGANVSESELSQEGLMVCFVSSVSLVGGWLGVTGLEGPCPRISAS